MKKIVHPGECSGPFSMEGSRACTCLNTACPLHGHCCDCMLYHRKRFLSMKNASFDNKNLDWLPKCYFPLLYQRYGYEAASDPEKKEENNEEA